MEKQGFEQILQQIAAINGTSSGEVRRQMEATMASALQNPDPAVRKMWSSIPRNGEVPTLDEFMEYLIEQKVLLP